MSENPYQSPSVETIEQVLGVISGAREDLWLVAVYQKGILFCILVCAVFYVTAFVGRDAIPPALRLVLGLGTLTVIVAGTIFVFLLATKVYGTAVGVLLNILALLPCIGLIVLLCVNGKATAILRQNGIRVELLGASLSKI